MLRGIARARSGSKRRGSHSHSWQSRKNVRSAVICPALVGASSGLPSRSLTSRCHEARCPTDGRTNEKCL